MIRQRKKDILKLSLISLPILLSGEALVLEDANVREKPSVYSDIINVRPKNDTVEVVRKIYTKNNGTWYQTKSGYISAELLKDLDNSFNPKTTIYRKASINDDKVYTIYNKDLNLYKEADDSSKLLDILKANNLLEIECVKTKVKGEYPWYKTKQGYISSPYLYNPGLLQNCEEPKVIASIPVVMVDKTNSIDENTNKNKKTENIEPKINKPKNIPVKKEKRSLVNNTKENTVSKKIIDKKTEDENRFFVGAIIGVNSLSVNTENKSGTITLNTPLDESGYSFNVHIGAKYDENYRVLLSYDYIPVDDVTLQNYYLSINYQFNTYLNPYLGISSGVSFLDWESDPLTNSSTKDTESEASGFIGLQTGLEYKYNTNYSIITQLLYQEFFHNTKVTNGSNEVHIKHDRVFQLGIGLRYSF